MSQLIKIITDRRQAEYVEWFDVIRQILKR